MQTDQPTAPFGEPVTFIHDRICLEHAVFDHHPERPERITAITSGLRESGLWDKVRHLDPFHAESTGTRLESITERIHPRTHIDTIRKKAAEAAHSGTVIAPFPDGGDTNMGARSFDAAMGGIAAAVTGIDELMQGSTRRVFCAVRPPGHHCERIRPMGFCLFNTIAVAARYALDEYGIDRVAIVDWDVHHGNGTQAIFYEDPAVLFISLHQYPHYPGTGDASERGAGKGENFTMNFPLPAGTVEETYYSIFADTVLPAVRKHRPGLILVSAGFDAHRDDPLGNILLTESSFARLTGMLSDVSSVCDGRIFSILEGGYNLHALARSVEAHLTALGGAGTTER